MVTRTGSYVRFIDEKTMKVPLLPFVDKVEEFLSWGQLPWSRTLPWSYAWRWRLRGGQCTDKVVDVPDVHFLRDSSVLPVEKKIELCQVQLVRVVHVRHVHTDVLLERDGRNNFWCSLETIVDFPKQSIRRSC